MPQTDHMSNSEKKPYASPELLEWGSLEEITLSSGSTGGDGLAGSGGV